MTLSGQSYICSAGETWDSVALTVYEDEKYACDLLNANPALSSIMIFRGGERLELPVIETPEYDGDEEYVTEEIMPTTAPWKE